MTHMSKNSFYLAKQIDLTLQGYDWPTAMDFVQIRNLHFQNDERGGRAVLSQLNDVLRSGELMFDNISVNYTWNHPANIIVGNLSAPNEVWRNYFQDVQKQSEQQKNLAHAPDCGWLGFLRVVDLDKNKALEGHACGCKVICTVTGVFKNGLPRYWNVEGIHDDGMKISFW